MSLRYVTLPDLVNAIPAFLQGSMTDDVANSATRVDDIVTELAEEAEFEVDSYASIRYTLPLIASDGTVPNSIKKAVLTITKYNLYARRDSLDPSVVSQYEHIISWLKSVNKGMANIPLLDASGGVETTGSSEIVTSPLTESNFSGVFF